MSTMVYGPPFVIDGPVPVAPPYRLLDTVVVITPDSPHWQNGVQLYPFPSDLPDATIPCADGTFRVKESGDAVDLPIFGPFAPYLAETCSALSIRDQDSYKARAELALDATISFALERQLVAGFYAPSNPFLGDSNVTFPAGLTAQNAIEGLSFLEDAIGLTGKQGVIHAPPSVIAAWDGAGSELIDRDGVLYTRRGTPIAVGDGYINQHPASTGAPAAGNQWAWASGPVQIFLAPMFMLPELVSEALDREINLITYRAERPAVVDWDTQLQAAVLIDRTA